MIASTNRGRFLTIGFAATIALWLVVYITAMPAVRLNPVVVALLAAVVLLAAGLALGRSAAPGSIGLTIRQGVLQGLVITGINLLLLGSLGSGETFADVLRSALQWIAGFCIASIILVSIGAALGRPPASARPRPVVNWSMRFAVVLGVATLFLVKSGGAVTTLEAGLAVPDWLTTFGYPMFFYPLELMRADEKVFVEHFHRLWGTLVGLCSIAMVFHLWAADSRRWTRWVSVVVLLMISAQGLMGASRVVERSLAMAIVHGIFGQIVFATIALLAAFVSTTWRSSPPPDVQQFPKARADRGMAIGLVGMLLFQLALGALYRHLHGAEGVNQKMATAMLLGHIAVAVLIAVKVPIVAIRAWGKYGSYIVMRRFGQSLLILLAVQIALGIAALLAVLARKDAPTPGAAEIILTTAHQATGALLFATAALYAAWTRRLLRMN